MSVLTKLPTTNLNWNDVRGTLNANGGAVTNNVASAFASAANINKWSKYKPVIYPLINVDDVTNWWNGAPRNNDVGNTTTGGMIIGSGINYLFGDITKVNCSGGTTSISTDTTGFLYKLGMKLLSNWLYMKPEGGASEPFRLGDFRGYLPNAVNPMPYLTNNVLYKYTSAGAVNILFNVPTPEDSSNLNLSDMSSLNINLSDMYVGILLYNSDMTDVLYVTQTAAQKASNKNQITILNNDYATITGRRGSYNAKLFLSSTPIELCNYTDDSGARTMIDCDSEAVTLGLLSIDIADVSMGAAEYKSITSTTGRWQVRVYNNTPAAVTVTQVKFSVNNGLLTEDYYASNVPITIAAMGSALMITSTDLYEQGTATVTVTANGTNYTE